MISLGGQEGLFPWCSSESKPCPLFGLHLKPLPIIYRLKKNTVGKIAGITIWDEVKGEYEVTLLKLRKLTPMYSLIPITTYKPNEKSPAIEAIFRRQQ